MFCTIHIAPPPEKGSSYVTVSRVCVLCTPMRPDWPDRPFPARDGRRKTLLVRIT